MVVVNKRNHVRTSNDVYIGRGSIWGNIYKIGVDGNRNEVIRKYRIYMRDKLMGNEDMIDKLLSLDGKCLVCYCKPLACHGDVLEEFIKEMKERI